MSNTFYNSSSGDKNIQAYLSQLLCSSIRKKERFFVKLEKCWMNVIVYDWWKLIISWNFAKWSLSAPSLTISLEAEEAFPYRTTLAWVNWKKKHFNRKQIGSSYHRSNNIHVLVARAADPSVSSTAATEVEIREVSGQCRRTPVVEKYYDCRGERRRYTESQKCDHYVDCLHGDDEEHCGE